MGLLGDGANPFLPPAGGGSVDTLTGAGTTGKALMAAATEADARTALDLAEVGTVVDLTTGMTTSNGAVTGGAASVVGGVVTLAHSSGLSQAYAGTYSAPRTRVALPQWRAWEARGRIASFTGNAGTVFGFAVGVGPVGFGALGATARRFVAARVQGDGRPGLLHNSDPATGLNVLCSPVSFAASTLDLGTGEAWLSLTRALEGVYLLRWGQGTLDSGTHLPPADGAWSMSPPVTISTTPRVADTIESGDATVVDVLPDALGVIVYQYTSATAVSASLAQLTMRRLA
ncbi:MAG: hypothetical protein JWM10_1930 [Myxococcaceae bacterium]|nr:hypothetical protein [Myxococcaceae bacterium]